MQRTKQTAPEGKALRPKKVRGDATKASKNPRSMTAEARVEFCRVYAQGGSVSKAAAAIGVHPVTIYQRIRTDDEFRAMYERAQELNTDTLEDSLHDIACGGNVTAIFGVLRARRPAVWREQHKVEHEIVLTTAEQLARARERIVSTVRPELPKPH